MLKARQETGLQAWDRLSEEQKACAKRVHTLIASMAREPWEPDEHDHSNFLNRLLPRIDPSRANRSVLIDGVRGSGKTTVLLDLLQHWSALLRGEEGLLKEVDDRRCCIVPVPIIDLHPLPDGANLAMLLLARIHSVSEAMSPLPTKTRPAQGTWLTDAAGVDPDDVDRKWQSLVTAVAGWMGGAEQRRLSVPAEEFALELAEQTLAGQGVERCFRDYVDQLLTRLRLQLGKKKPPLLVVPIDDADMSPQRAAELLELLRSLYHSRVLFLLTGDSDLFLTALRGYYLGALWRPLGGTPSGLDHLVVGQTNDAVRLALEVYGRVIPPDHRCRLRRSAKSLLKLELSPLDDRSVADALAEISLLYPQPKKNDDGSTTSDPRPDKNLLDLFQVRICRDPESTDEVGELSRLRAALPERLRDAIDLVRGLDQLRGEANNSRTLDGQTERALAYLWNRTIADECRDPGAQRSLEKVLKVEDRKLSAAPAHKTWAVPSTNKRMLLVDSEKVNVSWTYREFFRLPTSPLGMTVALRSRVRMKVRFWRDGIAPRREEPARRAGDEREPPITLSTRTVAILKLVTDVIATREFEHELASGAIPGETGFVGGSLLDRTEFEGEFVRVNYHSAALDKNLRFVWRLPRWDSFLDFDLFEHLWEYYAPLAGRPDQLARIFVLLAVAVSRRADPNDLLKAAGVLPLKEVLAGETPDAAIPQLSWELLGRVSGRSGPDWWNARRSAAFTRWRDTVVPLLGAPEAGLADNNAANVLDFLGGRHLKSDAVLKEIAFERRRHLRAVIAAADQTARGGVRSDAWTELERELHEKNFLLTNLLQGAAPTPPPTKSTPPPNSNSDKAR
jgi:hypothetical protein